MPTTCTTKVIVPLSLSAEAIVRGIRSPFAPTRTITKCPAFRERAINGASTTSLTTFSEKYSFLIILFILNIYCSLFMCLCQFEIELQSYAKIL